MHGIRAWPSRATHHVTWLVNMCGLRDLVVQLADARWQGLGNGSVLTRVAFPVAADDAARLRRKRG
jgi:hypothetical protein